MIWLAVHTQPRQEEVAEKHLRQQGFAVFLPRLRQRKRRGTRWQWVVGPLFPRYLFIQVELGRQSTASIRSTRGVIGLVRFGQELVPVDPSIIHFLMDHQDPELAAQVDDAWPHRPGDRVEIADGPFSGLSGIYQISDDVARATLLIEILGRKAEVVVDRQSLGDTL